MNPCHWTKILTGLFLALLCHLVTPTVWPVRVSLGGIGLRKLRRDDWAFRLLCDVFNWYLLIELVCVFCEQVTFRLVFKNKWSRYKSSVVARSKRRVNQNKNKSLVREIFTVFIEANRFSGLVHSVDATAWSVTNFAQGPKVRITFAYLLFKGKNQYNSLCSYPLRVS